jgi:hypothetical protein
VESAERAYNGRVAGERGSGLSDLARDSIVDVGISSGPGVSGNQPHSCSSFAGVVPVGHPQDAVGHRDRGNHNSKSPWL